MKWLKHSSNLQMMLPRCTMMMFKKMLSILSLEWMKHMDNQMIISMFIFKLKMLQAIQGFGFHHKGFMLDFSRSIKNILIGHIFSKEIKEVIKLQIILLSLRTKWEQMSIKMTY